MSHIYDYDWISLIDIINCMVCD